jgi:hypothetical protein
MGLLLELLLLERKKLSAVGPGIALELLMCSCCC